MERDEFHNLSCRIFFISTHTLTWSVTSSCLTFIVHVYNFNSHAHVERDILGGFSLLVLFKISTHTLTWSVTYQLFADVF